MFTGYGKKNLTKAAVNSLTQHALLSHLILTVTALITLVLVVLMSGCDGDRHALHSSNQNTMSATVDKEESDRTALRPAYVDESIPSLGVESLLRNQETHSGRLAVEGVVVQCFEERGAFVVVDLEEFKSCGLEACTDAAMPIRIERDQFEGVLPVPGELVTLICDFESIDRGFQCELQEVKL